MAFVCGDIEVITHPTSVINADSHYSVSGLHSTTFTQGSVLLKGHMPLPCDVLFEYDLPIELRDGVTVYADVYRPPLAKDGSVPAIIVAGPFGKNGGPNRYHFDKFPWRMGCPRDATSGLEKFEGPDPAYWCLNGYAIVHTDNRGTWNSGGDVVIGCTEEGKDGYDMVEWVAKQTWCNGKVTMAGNSYLAMTQWFIGAQNPPHLACLAPWEGWSDLYNDTVRRGGIPNPGFIDGLLTSNIASSGKGKTEDLLAMTETYPLWNAYWESRRAKVENIQCPVYVVASWTNALHTAGTFRGFLNSGSNQKWLRVHNTHEWPDLYDTRNVEDLRAFYDYFMKNIKNDWVYTPRVRLSILNAGGDDIVNRPEKTFPLSRQQSFKLYLDPTKLSLSSNATTASDTIAYDAVKGSVVFTLKPTSRMEFTGYSKLRVWMSTSDSNDMDIYVILQKYDSSTNKLLESPLVDVGRHEADPDQARSSLIRQHEADPSFCEGYFASGPTGCLRASHRELDPSKSSDFEPVYQHKREQLLEKDEVVPLDIALWPYGMICEKGQELRLTISGVNPRPHLRPSDPRPKLRNKGEHRLHFGDERESFLLLPLIPSE